jgi:hypothetical protein
VPRYSSSLLTRIDKTIGRSTLTLLCTSLLSFVVYYVTLVPEVDWLDSAELSLQAHQLGVSHPPGYPVHALLGRVLNFVISNPAIATNLLSALCTSVTVGLMSLMILSMTDNLYGAILVPLSFAFSPRIWPMAVTTEVYNVNILFLSLSVFLILRWHKDPSWGALLGSALFFGISLGTYLANALLFPAFAFLLLRQRRKWLAQAVTFSLIVAILAAFVMSFSYFRSRTLPPIGTEFIPGSFDDSLKYFSGRQYGTTEAQSSSFYLSRPMDHAWIFAKNFLVVGIAFGLIGGVSLWRSKWDVALFFLLILAINLGFFTFYRAGDYYNMVTPSYFVFSLLIAYGFNVVWMNHERFRVVALTVLVLMCSLLFLTQLKPRVKRSNRYPVTEFSRSTFNIVPANAVVISGWTKFTPLLFFQKTEDLRMDCTLIERSNHRRYYEHGQVDSYKDYIDSKVSSRLIVIDQADSKLRSRYEVTPLDENWFLLTPLEGQPSYDSP